jgi:hypothetical protein
VMCSTWLARSTTLRSDGDNSPPLRSVAGAR